MSGLGRRPEASTVTRLDCLPGAQLVQERRADSTTARPRPPTRGIRTIRARAGVESGRLRSRCSWSPPSDVASWQRFGLG